jgi:hypothetical protein
MTSATSDTNTQAELRHKAARARAAGPALWNAGVARRAAWLADALALLAPGGALFHAALTPIAESTGLSVPMVHWALDSSLSEVRADALLAWERAIPLPSPRALRARPGALCVVVLAGNVFTAAVRGVVLPLLLGTPVLAKSAAHDDAFVRWLARAFEQADPALAASFQSMSFASDDAQASALLLQQADTVVAYGSDATLAAIRAQLSSTVSFVGHGHGLGAAFVDRGVLQARAEAEAAAGALALDVAAYDQRGCMSPLVAWVVPGQAVSPELFAQFVFEALAALAQQLPRGPLPLELASAQQAFRGVAALHGRLFEGDGYAVAYEGDGPLRIAPGHRNLQLLDIADTDALCARLAALGVHLKCLGVAGVRDAPALLQGLPARVAPRVCALGSMQRPRLDALQDGVSAFQGLVRYSEHEL